MSDASGLTVLSRDISVLREQMDQLTSAVGQLEQHMAAQEKRLDAIGAEVAALRLDLNNNTEGIIRTNSILTHGIPGARMTRHLVEPVAISVAGAALAWFAPLLADAVLGMVAGAITYGAVRLARHA